MCLKSKKINPEVENLALLSLYQVVLPLSGWSCRIYLAEKWGVSAPRNFCN